MFKKREELNHVRMFGTRAFLQSAGFFRLRNGENPLDATGIHPESYFIVENMCKKLGVTVDRLIRNNEVISQIKPENYVIGDFGIPTVKDILKELEAPGRDPRKNFEVFEFEEGIEGIEDLQEGMVLKGVVTNVTRFGAFVDIGVHQDGLVHISELSHDFITNPEEVVKVEDKVKVKVLGVDLKLSRIQLSIKTLQDPPKKRKSKNKAQEGRHRKPHIKKKDKTGDLLQSLKEKWGAK
jgi:uncharacterized protein